MSNYHFLIILISILILYGVSVFLVKKNKINLITHRRIWNVLLLITFVISGITGLVLAFCIDMNISFPIYKEFLWFHVEFGIAMAIISIFHLLSHFKYYKHIFSKNKNNYNL